MWQLICLQLETCLSHQFSLGKCLPERAWGPSCVALAWHWASGSTPYGVTAGYIFVTWVALETLATKPTSHLISQTPCPNALASSPISITAFTSYRTNLSPFTKSCREWDASMWLSQFLGSLVLQLYYFHTYKFHTARAIPSNTLQECWRGISPELGQSLPHSPLLIHPCGRGNSAISDA